MRDASGGMQKSGKNENNYECYLKYIDAMESSRFYKILLQAQKAVMFATNVVLILVLGIVVLCRHVLHVDFFGFDEIILLAAFWMYFIGSSYAMQEKTHIKADILANVMSPFANRLAKVLSGIVQTAISAFLIVMSFNLVMRSMVAKAVTSAWNIPFYVPQMAILVGFALMTFYSAIHCARDTIEMLCASKRRG